MNQNPAGNSTLTIAPGRVPDGLLMIWTTSEFGCWKRILSQHALHHGLLASNATALDPHTSLDRYSRRAWPSELLHRSVRAGGPVYSNLAAAMAPIEIN